MGDAGPLLGAVLELDVEAPAAGGACVARHGPSGRVVFVRHTLPGERVRVKVTEDRGGSYCRGDAVEILRASPDRVPSPCRYAGPGRCGGCDWQHVDADAQRALKATVVRDQFARIAGMDLGALFTGVEALPGGLLGWRTRIAYAVDKAGRPGLRRHGSHAVEHVEQCLLGVPGVGDSDVLAQRWEGRTGVEVVRGDDAGLTVLERRPGPGRQARGRRPPDRVTVTAGPTQVHRTLQAREFGVAANGFWQVHPALGETLAAALLAAVAPLPGETVLDLYSGAGALTAVLAEAVGPLGRVVGLESDRQAVRDAGANLADLPWAQVRRERITADSIAALGGDPDSAAGLGDGSDSVAGLGDGSDSAAGLGDGADVTAARGGVAGAPVRIRPDVVVLDPPRAGAGPPVLSAVLALAPRAVGYVSCDPATLARDVAAAVRLGWRLDALRVFDAFPMTGHVECVATLVRGGLTPLSGHGAVTSSP